MNERIKELAEQAGLQCNKDEAICFAELIVKECSQLILDKKMGDLGDNPGVKAWEEGYNEAVHDCYYLIRKHFGVEE